jgi:hypothetical protein
MNKSSRQNLNTPIQNQSKVALPQTGVLRHAPDLCMLFEMFMGELFHGQSLFLSQPWSISLPVYKHVTEFCYERFYRLFGCL